MVSAFLFVCPTPCNESNQVWLALEMFICLSFFYTVAEVTLLGHCMITGFYVSPVDRWLWVMFLTV